MQKALEDWVENAVAPESLIATKYINDAASTRAIHMTRLLCPYPPVARYKQTGDPTNPAYFECVVP